MGKHTTPLPIPGYPGAYVNPEDFDTMSFEPFWYCGEEITQPIQVLPLCRWHHAIVVSRRGAGKLFILLNDGTPQLTEIFGIQGGTYYTKPPNSHQPVIWYTQHKAFDGKTTLLPLATALNIHTPKEGPHANKAGFWSAKALLVLRAMENS